MILTYMFVFLEMENKAKYLSKKQRLLHKVFKDGIGMFEILELDRQVDMGNIFYLPVAFDWLIFDEVQIIGCCSLISLKTSNI